MTTLYLWPLLAGVALTMFVFFVGAMNVMWFVVAGILLILFALAVRIVPIWKSRYAGCDAYYYLLCMEEFKERKKLPIVLPKYFLLDIQEQWYPPVFIVFLSLFNKDFIKKYYWAISPMIDMFILVGLYAITYALTGNILASTIAGLVYALTPAVISECSNLNSRLLGSLFLTATMVSVLLFVNTCNYYLLLLSILFGVILLMTHKMSAQLLYFVLPLMSLVFWDYRYMVVVLLIFIFTLLVFGEMFIKVLKGQYDILRFWNRNWKNLGAHQVNSSPIYGDEKRIDENRVFKRGLKGLYRHARSMGVSPFAVMLVFPLMNYSLLSMFDKQVFWWVVISYALVALTLIIPNFRFYGEGYKYLRMTVFPVAYLAGLPIYYKWDVMPYFYIVLGFVVLLDIVALVLMHRWRVDWSNPSLDDNLSKILEFIKGNEKVKVILSVPTHLMDTIAYHCRKQVIWGTHSDNFDEVEPLFPVYRKPLEYFVKKYGISHIVVDDKYVKPEAIGLAGEIYRSGRYRIYET